MHSRCSLSGYFFSPPFPVNLRERDVFMLLSFGAKIIPPEGQALGLVVVLPCGTFAESFGIGRHWNTTGPEGGQGCVILLWQPVLSLSISCGTSGAWSPSGVREGPSKEPWGCGSYLAWGWISCSLKLWFQLRQYWLPWGSVGDLKWMGEAGRTVFLVWDEWHFWNGVQLGEKMQSENS